MADLSMLALACDRTRVLTFVFSLPAAHVYYRHLGTNMDADFHDTICHGDPGDQSNQPRVDTGVHYEMTCLNEFLTKMQSHGSRRVEPARPVAGARDVGYRVGQDAHRTRSGRFCSRARPGESCRATRTTISRATT